MAHTPSRTLIGFAAALAAAAASVLPIVATLNFAALDTSFRVLREVAPRAAPDNIALIGIDDATLTSIAEPMALWHRPLATLFDALAAAQPRAVGLDVVLPDRSYDNVLPGLDSALVGALLRLRQVAPVQLAITTDVTGRERPVHPALVAAVGPQHVGLALFPLDADFVVRRFDESLGRRGEQLPTLAGNLARALGLEPAVGLIDFTRGEAFSYVPMHVAIDWARRDEREQLKRHFASKVVIVGSTLAFEDRLAQPVNLAAWDTEAAQQPGMLLHAQYLRTLFAAGPIRSVDSAWAVLAAAVLAGVFFWFPGVRRRVVLGVVLALLLFVASALGLLGGVWFAPVAPMLGIALGAGARLSLDALAARQERERLRRAFAGYVSPGVLQSILSGNRADDLRERRDALCFLFADLRGFTPLSETLDPRDTIELLNTYYEAMIPCVHAQHGTIDNFRGDGIMVVFGAPEPLDRPAARALTAARAMFEALGPLNAHLKSRGLGSVDFSVGLSSGEAVVGFIGTQSRHDYTAIGDAVNIAARLQALCPTLGYRLVADEWFVEACAREGEPRGEWVELGKQSLKGHSPVYAFGWVPARVESGK